MKPCRKSISVLSSGASGHIPIIDTNYTFDGKIDEVVVFDRFLEPAETTAIRNGTYPNIVPV